MDSILSKIAEYTIEPIGRLLGRQVGYVIHCKTNIQKLKDQVKELKEARQATDSQVAEAERKGEKIRHDVQSWLKKVDEITAQADELLQDESQAKLKCLHGFCPNLTVRHQLSSKSTKLVEEVVEHSGKRGLISQVSCGILRKEVLDVTNRDYLAFQSRTSIVKEIMDHLKDPKIERMGVCGMGGVGKTTLAKEVYKQASGDKELFDNVVILLDVKKNPDLEAIQKVIVEKLGMEILPNETKDGRASRLCGKIQDKKILVILDDVEEKIDLEAVGLPRLPTCKILLTCRTREVFDEMRADKVFQLDLLGKEDAWNLFVKMAGDVINQNGDIRDVAMEVAERCGGLPLLVVTVASALKQKNELQLWRDALRRLKRFDKEKLTENAYLVLEWSYDQLDDKELKPLFLLCGVMVKKNHIYVPFLFNYGMGLSLFQNVNTVAEARDALDSLLKKLKDSCLLLDSDVNGMVRMHDLVCHVANRIAYRDQHVLSVEYEGELKEWPNKDFLRKCTKIHLRPSKIPPLPEIPLECPELELFYLCRGHDSVEIPSNFFREMQKLKVLDLTRMRMPSLPLSLQYLKKLQTLCLDQCMLGDITVLGQLSNLEILSFFYSKIKELPKEIGQLTRLRLLDLSNCSQLEVIPPNVISSLVRLEDLRMRNSFNKWEVEGEGSHMASLSELKHLSQLSALEIHIPNADVLPANLFSNKFERFNIVIGDAWVNRYSWGATTLDTLKLKLTKSNNKLDEGLKLLLMTSEDLSLDETEVVIINQLNTEDFGHLKHLQLQNSIADIINWKVVFPNLSTLTVHGCDNLKFLFSFSMARSLVQLTQLEVSTCKLMQEIVGEEEEEEVLETTLPQIVFPNVTSVTLRNLPQLRRFYPRLHTSYWPLLKELVMVECDKVEILAAEFSIFREKYEMDSSSQQPFFITDKDPFPNLEYLELTANEIWNGPAQSELVFGKLKSIRFYGNCAPFSNQASVIFLERLQNLEKIAMWSSSSSSEEIFVNRGISSRGEIRDDDDAVGSGTLPRVRILNLTFMDGLMHLGNDNSQSAAAAAGPVLFPNLEILGVNYCNGLKSVRSSSAISFRNLITLTVTNCHGLEYLTTYSVAKSLMQLTTLEVRQCESILVIVRSNDQDDDDDAAAAGGNINEIAFSRLQHLKLFDLPRLQGFCSRNCTVKFPSSMALDVDKCPIKLKISPDGVLLTETEDEDETAQRNPEILSEGPPASQLPAQTGVARKIPFQNL